MWRYVTLEENHSVHVLYLELYITNLYLTYVLSTFTCTWGFMKILVLDSSTIFSTWPQVWPSRIKNVQLVAISASTVKQQLRGIQLYKVLAGVSTVMHKMMILWIRCCNKMYGKANWAYTVTRTKCKGQGLQSGSTLVTGSMLQPSILRQPLIIRPLDLVPKGNFLC